MVGIMGKTVRKKSEHSIQKRNDFDTCMGKKKNENTAEKVQDYVVLRGVRSYQGPRKKKDFKTGEATVRLYKKKEEES